MALNCLSLQGTGHCNVHVTGNRALHCLSYREQGIALFIKQGTGHCIVYLTGNREMHCVSDREQDLAYLSSRNQGTALYNVYWKEKRQLNL